MASRGVNKVILIGNVGQDPEVRFTPNGVAVANVRLATSESWKDQSGQLQERTEWHHLVVYRRLAEIVGEYVKKGSKLYIEGKLATRKWQDKTGQDRYTTEIVVDEMQMLGERLGGDGRQGGGGQQQGRGQGNDYNQGHGQAKGYGQSQGRQSNQGQGHNNPSHYENTPDFDDDIPF